ncbi:MAG: ubiquinol-cytochrome c reductase iron-sulfur subunit [Gaiellaceae bacterium]
MSRLRNAIVSGLVLLLGRGRRRPPKDPSRLVPALPPSPGAELVVLLLLGLSALSALGFILVYAFASHLPSTTQLFGLTLGGSLLFLAAALIVVGLKLVPNEEFVEPYPPTEHPGEQQVIAEVLEESGSRFSRRRLVKLGLLGAGGTLGLALLAPAVSLGPLFQVRQFLATPWRRGRRLVDDKGTPFRASDIEPDNFYLAFPEGAREPLKEDMSSSLMVFRLPPSSLRLPPRLRDYPAGGGIVAYSRICTHAGCAINMLRTPLFQPDEPKPALVCPCHYSTFDPATGGTVIFGPAGRDLPMLPIYVDAQGYLRAKGNFDEPVGPSWWGVRMYRPNP